MYVCYFGYSVCKCISVFLHLISLTPNTHHVAAGSVFILGGGFGASAVALCNVCSHTHVASIVVGRMTAALSDGFNAFIRLRDTARAPADVNRGTRSSWKKRFLKMCMRKTKRQKRTVHWAQLQKMTLYSKVTIEWKDVNKGSHALWRFYY